MPLSRVEQEKLGSLGEKARTMASEQKQGLTDSLREKKDDLVGRVDDKLQQGGDTGSQSGSQLAGGQPSGDTFHAPHDQGSAQDFGAPKI